MNFNRHSNLEGLHAFLGGSNYQWLNYTDEKLVTVYNNSKAKERGTELHELAAKCIKLGQKLPASKKTLNMYVNDAIGYKMTPEQPLYFSTYIFGTADTISFRKGFLRIHDLKTGVIPAKMEQLLIYDALFCLEYHESPGNIQIENRIYQNDDIFVANPTAEDILPIMDKIVTFDKILTKMNLEEA